MERWRAGGREEQRSEEGLTPWIRFLRAGFEGLGASFVADARNSSAEDRRQERSLFSMRQNPKNKTKKKKKSVFWFLKLLSQIALPLGRELRASQPFGFSILILALPLRSCDGLRNDGQKRTKAKGLVEPNFPASENCNVFKANVVVFTD